MGILCVFCIYDTIGNDINIVSKNGMIGQMGVGCHNAQN